MKQLMKNLLVGIGVASIGYLIFAIQSDNAQNKERRRKAAEAEKRAALMALRKAREQAMAAAQAAESKTDQNLPAHPECQYSVEEVSPQPVETVQRLDTR